MVLNYIERFTYNKMLRNQLRLLDCLNKRTRFEVVTSSDEEEWALILLTLQQALSLKHLAASKFSL
jgi:hypothetical protein